MPNRHLSYETCSVMDDAISSLPKSLEFSIYPAIDNVGNTKVPSSARVEHLEIVLEEQRAERTRESTPVQEI